MLCSGISGFSKRACTFFATALPLLAQAVTSLYPNAKPTIGPAIDRGFYYDFADLEDFGEAELKGVQKKMHEIARRNLSVERVECTDSELNDLFQANPYKIEIINDKLEDGDSSTIYRQGEWYDLCLGPHVHSTAKLMHVRLHRFHRVWRGDQIEKGSRIYGIVEPTKDALEATMSAIEELRRETTGS